MISDHLNDITYMVDWLEVLGGLVFSFSRLGWFEFHLLVSPVYLMQEITLTLFSTVAMISFGSFPKKFLKLKSIDNMIRVYFT